MHSLTLRNTDIMQNHHQGHKNNSSRGDSNNIKDNRSTSNNEAIGAFVTATIATATAASGVAGVGRTIQRGTAAALITDHRTEYKD